MTHHGWNEDNQRSPSPTPAKSPREALLDDIQTQIRKINGDMAKMEADGKEPDQKLSDKLAVLNTMQDVLTGASNIQQLQQSIRQHPHYRDRFASFLFNSATTSLLERVVNEAGSPAEKKSFQYK
jgi:Skp family chaperone for outer membrane proteins